MSAASSTEPAWSREGLRLASLGFATLFLELVLIRYLAGNIWNLGYFPNLVLIAVFVGMGLGFTLHGLVSPRRSVLLFHAAPFLLLGLVLFVYFGRPSVPGFGLSQGDLGGELYFTNTPTRATHQTPTPFIVCVAAIALVFALISQQTAKTFRRFPPLTAYTLDIAGSCLGVASFMVVSALRLPAFVWFLPVGVLLVLAAPGSWKARWLPLVPCAFLVVTARAQDAHPLIDRSYDKPFEVIWSPYQKIELIDAPKRPLTIYVNGIPHQGMQPPSVIKQMSYQRIHDARVADGLPRYKNVLVLGAGSGNDVAAALMNGAEHVDAVEIDPVIADLGLRHHPAAPYSDRRVNLVIDDGRAFMTQTHAKYDLVIFALTDSLVKVSSMSQLRLENYLFTFESVQRAYALLEEGGDIVFYNYYRYPWLFQKIVEMTRRATGTPPTVLLDADFKVLRARKAPAPEGVIGNTEIDIPTDDWPFLYLERRAVPTMYLWGMAGMLAIVVGWIAILHRTAKEHAEHAGKRSLQIKLAFLFMGVAFLLLETKSVIQFSLLFGTTWKNNSFVFLAVLLLVLAANWTARFLEIGRALPLIYGLLLVASLVSLVFPIGRLLAVEAVWLRVLFAAALTFAPIYLANLIFSLAFREEKLAEHVFGWNLIGSTLGGVAEYLSMAVGYNTLAIVVAASYVVAFLMLWDARRKPSATAEA